MSEVILFFQQKKKSFSLKNTFYCVAAVSAFRNVLYFHSVTGFALDNLRNCYESYDVTDSKFFMFEAV